MLDWVYVAMFSCSLLTRGPVPLLVDAARCAYLLRGGVGATMLLGVPLGVMAVDGSARDGGRDPDDVGVRRVPAGRVPAGRVPAGSFRHEPVSNGCALLFRSMNFPFWRSVLAKRWVGEISKKVFLFEAGEEFWRCRFRKLFRNTFRRVPSMGRTIP